MRSGSAANVESNINLEKISGTKANSFHVEFRSLDPAVAQPCTGVMSLVSGALNPRTTIGRFGSGDGGMGRLPLLSHDVVFLTLDQKLDPLFACRPKT